MSEVRPEPGEVGLKAGENVWACVWDLASKCGLKRH